MTTRMNAEEIIRQLVRRPENPQEPVRIVAEVAEDFLRSGGSASRYAFDLSRTLAHLASLGAPLLHDDTAEVWYLLAGTLEVHYSAMTMTSQIVWNGRRSDTRLLSTISEAGYVGGDAATRQAMRRAQSAQGASPYGGVVDRAATASGGFIETRSTATGRVTDFYNPIAPAASGTTAATTMGVTRESLLGAFDAIGSVFSRRSPAGSLPTEVPPPPEKKRRGRYVNVRRKHEP